MEGQDRQMAPGQQEQSVQAISNTTSGATIGVSKKCIVASCVISITKYDWIDMITADQAHYHHEQTEPVILIGSSVSEMDRLANALLAEAWMSDPAGYSTAEVAISWNWGMPA